MKTEVTNMAAAILAGGRNSRMAGFNKALIRINGIQVIQRTLKLLEKIFEEVIIVANSPGDFISYEKKALITKDLIKDVGPLGGIYSALSVTSKEAVFFVACDMPFLHNALVNRLVDCFNILGCDVAVPRIGSSIEPLHAIYSRNLKDKLGSFLGASKDYSVRSFLGTVNAGYLDLGDNPQNRAVFKNLNSPEDLKKIAGASWK